MQVTVGPHVFDVVVDGPADAPAVLLLHGFPQSAHSWRAVRPFLDGYRVIAPDQRGYSPGARPAGTEAYRLPELVADALGLLDALGVEQAHVVGHDWGAAVAWQLGARHSPRVRTLTTVSVPHPRAFVEALRTDADQRQRSLYMREFATPGYDARMLADDAAGLRGLFGGSLPTVDVEHLVARAQQPGALAAWLQWYAAQRLEDIADTPAVGVPTLHVWSDGDAALGRAGAVGTAAWVTGPYRFEVLEGVSHWVPEEAADRLGPLLAAHLAG
jgi:pimeloyl-ACP methyl ester carboxylesterase